MYHLEAAPEKLSQCAYLEIESKCFPERMVRVRDIAAQLWVMSPTCRLSVCIPAYREAGIIGNTLQHYTAYQTCAEGRVLDPKIFEINILINRPNPESEIDSAMLAEIESFRLEHPEYRINVADVVYDFPDRPVIGLIFKDIADAVIVRNLARNIPSEFKSRLILRTAGADVEALNPLLISRTLDIFSDKKVMAHRGETRLPPTLLWVFPLLDIMQKFAVFMLRQYHGSHTTNGPFSYTAEVYSLVHWFNSEKILGEEIDLAQRIWKHVHGSEWRLSFVKDGTKDVINNPRRQVHALLQGAGMAGRYQDFWWQINEHAVRTMSLAWRTITAEFLPTFCTLTAENLSREITAYYRTYLKIGLAHLTSPEHIDILFGRALEVCGITDYQISRNTELAESCIQIHTIDSLLTQMEQQND